MQSRQKSSTRGGRVREKGDGTNTTATIDDVFVALHDLCVKLQIGTTRAAHRTLPKRAARRSPGKVHYAEMGRLLAAWYQNPSFLDESGNPQTLRITGRHSFAQLAKSTAAGISSALLLSELEKTGAVAIESGGNVRVKTRSLDVYTDRKLATEYTLSSLVSYIRTLIYNLESSSSMRGQLFHRVAVNEEFHNDLVPLLNAYVRRRGEVFLVGFDDWMSRKTRARAPGSKTKGKLIRATVGLYLSVDERDAKK